MNYQTYSNYDGKYHVFDMSFITLYPSNATNMELLICYLFVTLHDSICEQIVTMGLFSSMSCSDLSFTVKHEQISGNPQYSPTRSKSLRELE